jgi:hypothetical protein
MFEQTGSIKAHFVHQVGFHHILHGQGLDGGRELFTDFAQLLPQQVGSVVEGRIE